MSDLVLKSVDITNFRSIRGHIHAPLDANVVLIHGENGAGKTSLLSAIELALTGSVQSLERADPTYEKQLLHRSASEGSVVLRADSEGAERSFRVKLRPQGVHAVEALDEQLAGFFRERVFLPQSLLGQLLQIYQDSGSDASSPLAQFVSKLLGLDRLDALEVGLKPFVDVRNVRKHVEGWLIAENEKARLERLLEDQNRARAALDEQVQNNVAELAALCSSLELPVKVHQETVDRVAEALDGSVDSEEFVQLAERQQRLTSIRREIGEAQAAIDPDAFVPPTEADDASKHFTRWEAQHGARVSTIRKRVEAMLPDLLVPSDPSQLAEEVLKRLQTEKTQLAAQVTQVRSDFIRHAAALDEREIARRQRETIDDELSRLSSNAGSLAEALAEVTSFILDDVCPVCDRNFREVGGTSLGEHVHHKVRRLSASAERLLTLGPVRSEVQTKIEHLDREIESIAARRLNEEALAEMDRRLASIETLIAEIESISEVLREGGQLRAAAIAARRAIGEAQARHVSLAAARETLSSFALSIGAPPVLEGESLEAAASRLDELVGAQIARLEERLSLRRRALDLISIIRSNIARRQEADTRIAADSAARVRVDQALNRAQILRDEANAIRNEVDKVRSAIIRREFNDRLNRVWRDLFVRLAPGEPFVPAFRIPPSSTHKLQPKLITEHRDDGEGGGTPGAMLSAGNLNTAALTLFIALHLAVPKELLWLILDDPVQSMDDVHIAHFAALLRTLSKEHGRQVVIAAHERQLFEYLKLELSPAFPGDSLLALELSRGPRRDSICISERLSFKEDSALGAVI